MLYNDTPNNISIRDLKDNYCLSVKATLNGFAFRTYLKCPRDDAFLINAGNLFHKLGAATLNTQSPHDLSTNLQYYPTRWSEFLGWIFLTDTDSLRYSGAISLIDLQVINQILKWTSCLTGSQFSCWRIELIWSYFRVAVATIWTALNLIEPLVLNSLKAIN